MADSETTTTAKICSDCQNPKPLCDYRPGRSRCKLCEGVKYRQWVKQNREKVRIINRRYRHSVEGRRRGGIHHQRWQKSTRGKELRKISDLKYIQSDKGQQVKKTSNTNYRESDKGRARYLDRYFKLTLDQHNQMEVFQENVCAICHKPPVTRRLATDHCHRTGLIRGRLCGHCNRVLGAVRDDISILIGAVLYLSRPPAIAALGHPHFGLPGRMGTKKQRKLAEKWQPPTDPELPKTEDVINQLEEAIRYLKNPPARKIS